MEKLKELAKIFLLSFILASFFIVGLLAVEVKKLKRDIIVLKEEIFSMLIIQYEKK